MAEHEHGCGYEHEHPHGADGDAGCHCSGSGSELVRFSVTAPDDLLRRFDEQIARRGDVAVRLHIVTRSVATHGHTDPKMPDALAFLDLIERINTAMQGLRGENFAGFQLTTSATNHDHAELMESVERYVTSAQDITAAPQTTPAQIASLNVRC